MSDTFVVDLHLRPRFILTVDLTPDEVMERMEQALHDPDNDVCVGHLLTHQIELTVPDSEQHTWSPHLNMVVRAEGEGSVLDGKFGPGASVWTFFLALYAALSLTGGAALLFAYSQWALKQNPSALVVVGICISLLGVVYAAGITGRTQAHDQMRLIRIWLARHLEPHGLRDTAELVALDRKSIPQT